jgi:PRC-barrel domain protein
MTLKSSSDGNARHSRPRNWPRSPWPTALSRSVAAVATMIVVVAAALVPVASAVPVELVVVDVVQVANGFRASKLRGVTVSNPQNQKIGDLDDLIVGKDRVLFAIVQVGGFLGVGSHLIAVPYSSLQINEDGTRIVMPGATREQVKGLPEFKYR